MNFIVIKFLPSFTKLDNTGWSSFRLFESWERGYSIPNNRGQSNGFINF